jgi:hypothetical protein
MNELDRDKDRSCQHCTYGSRSAEFGVGHTHLLASLVDALADPKPTAIMLSNV